MLVEEECRRSPPGGQAGPGREPVASAGRQLLAVQYCGASPAPAAAPRTPRDSDTVRQAAVTACQ